MTDFPPNSEDAEFRLPPYIINKIDSTDDNPQKTSHPIQFGGITNNTHATQISAQPKEPVERFLLDAASNVKFCGASGSSNPNGNGYIGGEIPTMVHSPYATRNNAFHFQPVIPSLTYDNYNYPIQQDVPGPDNKYNYPITMFAPSQNQGFGIGPEAIVGKTNFPSSPVLQVTAKEGNGHAAKWGGTGFFLPNKEAFYKNNPKEHGGVGVLRNYQAVSSTGKKKNSGKSAQGDQPNTNNEETSFDDELQLPPGISLPKEWTY